MGERIFPAVEEGIKIYLKSHADSKISSMMFHEQDGANDGFAANWHPTEKTHQKAATVLTEKLREIIKRIYQKRQSVTAAAFLSFYANSHSVAERTGKHG